jgi:hypothetical protein
MTRRWFYPKWDTHGIQKVCKLLKADVAQLVEQPIRNRQVSGSSPLVGSIFSDTYKPFHCTLNSY